MAKKLTYSRYIWFINRAKKGRFPWKWGTDYEKVKMIISFR